MQWVDWQHFENFQMKDLMGFKYDWNAEIIAQFHATFFYDSYADSIHWMTEVAMETDENERKIP
jgi:hypothetical protein